jgi:pimeloyl-ACP methyl ester carboxylesterase
MTLMDGSPARAAQITQAGEGRPVLVLGPGFAGTAAFDALAKRFRVLAMDTAPADVPAWIAEQGFGKLGIVGIGEAAGAAVAAAAAGDEAIDALVLVSPIGLPLGDADGPLKAVMKAIPVPKCVLIGDRDPAARPLADYKTALARSLVVLVFDAGADILAERPDAFVSAAGDFLDRQARFSFVAEDVAISA